MVLIVDLQIVIDEIEKNRRIQFDPQIADVFLDILRNHYEETGVSFPWF